MDSIILALIAATGTTFTLWKIFGMKAIRYDWFFDAIMTLGFPFLFFGSYAGMTLAVLTGIFMSIQLFILKKLLI